MEIVLLKNYHATFSLPQQYLYEPNASLLKSGYFNAISELFGVAKLHQHSHLYTSNENKEFQGRASRTLLSTWWDAIAQSPGLDISLEPTEKGNGIPNHKSWERRFPEAYHRLEVVRPLVLELAAELKIPVENLLQWGWH